MLYSKQRIQAVDITQCQSITKLTITKIPTKWPIFCRHNDTYKVLPTHTHTHVHNKKCVCVD